jgi:hypothetical protein
LFTSGEEARDIMGYHAHQKKHEEMGQTMQRTLEHCPKVCKLNAEDTYFRDASFTNFLGASAIASTTSI